MTARLHLHERPARTYARAITPGEIPQPSYTSARDTVQRTAKTRAGMVCGVVIAALVQFVPDGGALGSLAHGPLAALLAVGPALVIAAVAFPLISWAAKRDERRLKVQYGIRKRK